MAAKNNSDELQPPGSGLPKLELAALKVAFAIGTTLMPDKMALKRFRSESKLLLEMADENESYDVFHPLVIPRVVGIEDSSRNWSVMMVMEHLCMTTTDIIKVINTLADGVAPRGELDIADYKPDSDVGYDVLDRFRSLEAEYCAMAERMMEARGSMMTAAKFPHPWFGLLNGHQWHCLAAIHHRIHRRQMQKLVAMLGVT